MTNKSRSLRLSCILLSFLFVALVPSAGKAGNVTPATGGGSISADNTGGTWTTLAGPIYSESASGNVGVGNIVLNVPAGFVFDTTGTPPTVLMERIGGGGSPTRNINAVASPATFSVTRTSAALTLVITSSSNTGVICRLTWQNVRVRPTAGTPLASGNITKSGTSVMDSVVNGVTNFGTLVEIVGAANRLTIFTQPPASVTAGVTFSPSPVVRIEDQFGNLRSADTLTVTASRSAGTDTLRGTTSVQAVSGVVTFNNLSYRKAETMSVLFSRAGLNSATSNNVVVSPTTATRLTFTTQPGNATAGVIFGTQPVVRTQDQFRNNSIVGLGSTVDVTVSLIAGTGLLQGTTTLNIGTGGATPGTVTYTNLQIDSAGSNKRLRAAATGLLSDTSVVFAVNNPVPTTTSINPANKDVGDTAFVMTVNGTNFVTQSVVQFAGSPRTTSFVNVNQLTAQIPATDLDTGGVFNVTVFNPAPGGGTSNAQSFTVNKFPSATDLESNIDTTVFGAPVTFTAAVSPTGVTGNVAFFDGPAPLGNANVVNDTATFITSSLNAGTHQIRAVYGGNHRYLSSLSDTVQHVVTIAATTTSVISSPSPSVYGQSVTFTATVTPSAATGTVQFFDGAALLGSAALSGGTAAIVRSTLIGGTHKITAVYGGSGNHNGSASDTLNHVVNKAATSTALASNINPVQFGQTVRFKATITPAGATGTVQFFDGITSLGTSPVSADTASIATSSLTLGNHSITATYSGDGNFLTSTSSPLVQNVKDTVAIVVTSSPNPSTYGQSVLFTATLTPGSATGTVKFYDGPDSIAMATISGGIATFSTSVLLAGSHSITAVYSGSVNYFARTSPIYSHTVNKAGTSTQLVSSLNPSVYGDTVVFRAKVSPATATGSVRFFDSTAVLGTVALTGDSARFITSSLTVRNHSITAQYLGDANYLTSTSAPVVQTVNKVTPTTTLTSSMNPAGFGQPVTFTATVSPSLATGTVRFVDSTTILGNSALSGGVATFQTSSLTIGNHPITAQYLGDANVNADTSSILIQSITVVANGGFEQGASFGANGWTVVNGSEPSPWVVGTAAKSGGNFGAYVSNDGGITNTYTIGPDESVTHFYQTVTFPAGEASITLSFDWRGMGEPGRLDDRISVYVTPNSFTPTAGLLVPDLYRVGAVGFAGQSTFTRAKAYIDGSFAGTSGKLIFTWYNDVSSGTQPGGAVDSIVITTKVAVPLSGTKTIGVAGDYTSFTAAFEALNENGVAGGGVTFNVAAGSVFVEDPPPLFATGSSGSPIVFQKSGVGANPLLRPTGGTGGDDFGICIHGGDYITFDGVDITINSGSALEYGYLIRNASAINGAQNNTIRNCKIVLNRSNSSSVALFQVTGTGGGGGGIPTAFSGTNSSNLYRNIQVENVYRGIWLLGDPQFPDQNCEVGSVAPGSTVVGSGSAGDIGNGSLFTFGIRLFNQDGGKVYGTTVRNVAHAGNTYSVGIQLENSALATMSSPCQIFNNTVHGIALTGGVGNGVAYGIRVDVSPGNSAHVYNNVVHSLSTVNLATSNVLVRGIAHGIFFIATGNGNYHFNSVRIDQGTALDPSSTAFWIERGTVTYRNNILTNFTGAQSGLSKHYAVYLAGGSVDSASHNILYAPNSNGFVGFQGVDRATLAAWAAAISPAAPSDGSEAGSANADPMFAGAANLTFPGPTPAANSGIPITSPLISTDILGNSGNRLTTPDIGAYETSSALIDRSAPILTNVVISSGGSPTVSVQLKDNRPDTVNARIRLWYRLAGTAGAYTGVDANTKPAANINGTYGWSTALGFLSPGTYEFYIAARDSGAPGTNINVNPVWTTSIAGFSGVDPPNYANNPASYANVRTFVKTPLPLNVTVYLEGPYNTTSGTMNRILRTSGILATRFPGIPIPAQAVDSVNIEIRSDTLASTSAIRAFAPAWLMTDGTVRSFNDSTKAYVEYNVPADSYYVVVKHRNHLAVMSSGKVKVQSAPTASWNFSTAASQAYGGGQKQIGTSPVRFGLRGGDGNGDGGVDAIDRNTIWRPDNGTSGYKPGDFNLDGGVDAIDRNVIWRPNNGTGTSVPGGLRPAIIKEQARQE